MAAFAPLLALVVSSFSLCVSLWSAYRGVRNADRQLATTYGASINGWADKVLTSLQDFLVAADTSIERQQRFVAAKLAANKLINFHDVGGLLFPNQKEPTLFALEKLNILNAKMIDELNRRDISPVDLSYIEQFRSEFVTAVRSSNGLRQLHSDVTRYLR